MSGEYSTTRWLKLRSQFRRDCELRQLPCGICKQPIDYALQHPHPGSFQADHIQPVRDRPEIFYRLDNLQPAHKACNEARHADAIDRTWTRPAW